jgi:hypothetical protein
LGILECVPIGVSIPSLIFFYIYTHFGYLKRYRYLVHIIACIAVSLALWEEYGRLSSQTIHFNVLTYQVTFVTFLAFVYDVSSPLCLIQYCFELMMLYGLMLFVSDGDIAEIRVYYLCLMLSRNLAFISIQFPRIHRFLQVQQSIILAIIFYFSWHSSNPLIHFIVGLGPLPVLIATWTNLVALLPTSPAGSSTQFSATDDLQCLLRATEQQQQEEEEEVEEYKSAHALSAKGNENDAAIHQVHRVLIVYDLLHPQVEATIRMHARVEALLDVLVECGVEADGWGVWEGNVACGQQVLAALLQHTRYRGLIIVGGETGETDDQCHLPLRQSNRLSASFFTAAWQLRGAISQYWHTIPGAFAIASSAESSWSSWCQSLKLALQKQSESAEFNFDLNAGSPLPFPTVQRSRQRGMLSPTAYDTPLWKHVCYPPVECPGLLPDLQRRPRCWEGNAMIVRRKLVDNKLQVTLQLQHAPSRLIRRSNLLLGLLPLNSPQPVEALLRYLGVASVERVPFQPAMTWRQYLSRHCDILRPPSEDLLETWAGLATDAQERQHLLHCAQELRSSTPVNTNVNTNAPVELGVSYIRTQRPSLVQVLAAYHSLDGKKLRETFFPGGNVSPLARRWYRVQDLVANRGRKSLLVRIEVVWPVVEPLATAPMQKQRQYRGLAAETWRHLEEDCTFPVTVLAPTGW